MVSRNAFFGHGSASEQNLLEEITIESLKMYGQSMYYIPRTLVSKDNILGEDRLSRFKTAFPIELYIENVDGFDGQGAFIQKFGLMMEQSATFVVARRRWNELIGKHRETILPNRPSEGDLIYFPLSKGLFEIKFVQHQDPFYQLGKLYVYKLQVELFQYASERIDTGIPSIDAFETLKTFSTDPEISPNAGVLEIIVTNKGSGYTSANVTIQPSPKNKNATAVANIVNGEIASITVTKSGTGYKAEPLVTITGDGAGATAQAHIKVDIDRVESFGDNNSFLRSAETVVFNESNPFGD
jgi:hypothetical protein